MTKITAPPIPAAVSIFLDTPKKGQSPRNWLSTTLFTRAAPIPMIRSSFMLSRLLSLCTWYCRRKHSFRRSPGCLDQSPLGCANAEFILESRQKGKDKMTGARTKIAIGSKPALPAAASAKGR